MSAASPPRAILIAGPTASGKSRLALAIARARRGVVINADSMQVYAEMRVLTARPTPADEAAAPHRLYGHVSAREPYSVARWLREVEAEITAAEAAGWLPIIVGGTGLYFKALTEGLSPVPEIPPDVRRHWRGEGARKDAADLHAELMRRDPLTAGGLRPSDRQRLVRALEVIDATGRPLAEWQKMPGTPVLDAASVAKAVVTRPRDTLYERSGIRFRQMMEQGALDEAGAILRMQLDPVLPAMSALGLKPLIAHARLEIDRAAAIQAATRETRHYIRRQLTWLRRYMIAWKGVSEQELQSMERGDIPFIDFLD